MYKGWVQCTHNFQKKAGFAYKTKQKVKGKVFKFLDCEVSDLQLEGMKNNWYKFNSEKELLEWRLEKNVDEAYGIRDGEVLCSLLGYNHYFFNRYTNLRQVSILKKWEEHNGLYVTSSKKYVHEGVIVRRAHITDKEQVYSEYDERIGEDTKWNQYNVSKLDLYIDCLNKIKDQLTRLEDTIKS